jgi:uncharacterized protein (DUF433 family)
MHPDHITHTDCAPLEAEQWLPVPEWPGYDVSDWGRIRSWKRRASRKRGWEIGDTPRVLKGKRWPDGRSTIVLSRNDGRDTRKYYIHSLVLTAFVGPCPEGMEACHFPNENPGDNRLSNLRWDTRRENRLDVYRNGGLTSNVLSEEDIPVIWGRLASGESMKVIANDYNISYTLIHSIKMGRAWSYLTRNLHALPANCFGRVYALVEADIPVIWSRLMEGETQGAIAKDFGVTRAAIKDIKRGHTWSHITRNLPGPIPHNGR